jgi:hypothetical protein
VLSCSLERRSPSSPACSDGRAVPRPLLRWLRASTLCSDSCDSGEVTLAAGRSQGCELVLPRDREQVAASPVVTPLRGEYEDQLGGDLGLAKEL